MKALLSQIFGTPKNHPRSRPFIDHIFSFTMLDDKIWFRNFQIADELNETTKKVEKTLIEIGPRFVLEPIRILAGGFSGAVLWDNPEYMTPSAERSLKRQEEAKTKVELERKEKRLQKKRERNQSEPDELDDVFADSETDDEENNGMEVDNSDESGSDDEENGMDVDDEAEEVSGSDYSDMDEEESSE